MKRDKNMEFSPRVGLVDYSSSNGVNKLTSASGYGAVDARRDAIEMQLLEQKLSNASQGDSLGQTPLVRLRAPHSSRSTTLSAQLMDRAKQRVESVSHSESESTAAE